jgi:hypothetical protein
MESCIRMRRSWLTVTTINEEDKENDLFIVHFLFMNICLKLMMSLIVCV